ncbi:MAG: hypothetical protein AABM29_06490 [Actinomycetota bacterium]
MLPRVAWFKYRPIAPTQQDRAILGRAMSEENVEIVRYMYEALNRWEAALVHASPDLEAAG